MELHEINQYNDSLFPVGIYHVTPYQCIPHGRGYRDLHWHEELQYVLVLSGQVTFQVNGKDYELHQNEVLFINKSNLHISTKMSQDAHYASLNFPEKMLSFFPSSRMYYDYVNPYTNSSRLNAYKFIDDKITQFLYKIVYLFQQSNNEYDISLLIIKLWNQSIHYFKQLSLPQDISFNKQQARIQEMLNFIHQNYENPLNLQDIADVGKISIAQCNRYFKSFVRMSPYEYLIYYRLQKSTDYLIESTFNINEIAHKVGFLDVNHFIHSFKKRYGKSPKRYQLEYLKMNQKI